jgi:spore germination protein YaaH/flagellar hook assembly protein FlgD
VRLSAALAATLVVTLVVPSSVAGRDLAPDRASVSASSRGADPAAALSDTDSSSVAGDRPAFEGGPGRPGSDRPGPLVGSLHYEDVLAHQNDRPSFIPGDRASHGFVPRPEDTWPVDGHAARALPAARASGRQLSAQPNGSIAIPAEPRSTDPSAPGGGSATAGPQTADDSSASSGAVEPAAPQAVVGDRLRREVFGFLPYWALTDSALTLDYSALSTVAYFGVGADAAGHLLKRDSDGTLSTGWGGWTSSRMTAVINAAHAARTRVVLTIQRFSWNSNQRAQTTTLLLSSSARQTLANEIAAAVRDRGADGVNLDFEPIPSGQTANFTAFVRQVRAALDARAPGYQLTFDSTGYVGYYDVAALTAWGAADAVLVMGYDYRTGSASSAGSIAPLNGPAYDLTDTLKAFLSRTSRSKIILGLPYYGRVWSTVSDAYHAATRPQGSTYGSSSAVPYANAVALANAYGRRYDWLEQSAWTAYTRRNCSTCPLTWREVYYDDAQSLGMKYDFVNYSDLRGVGMWALSYDGTRPELYALLKTKFVNDRTRPLAGIVNLAPISRNEGVYVDWTAVDDYTGITFYDVQVSRDGGAWVPWLTATRAGAGTYLGQSGHGYAFRVRAMDGVGNWSLWNVTNRWQATPSLSVGSFATVAVDALVMRGAPSTSADSLGSLTSGDVVALTGGPVEADGFTWYQATGPLHEWGNVAWTTQQGMWLAAGNGTDQYLQAAQSPNATTIDADITGLGAGAVHEASLTSATSTGTSTSGTRAFSPNGDGFFDALRLTYTLTRPLETLDLRAYRLSSRTLVGERALPGLGAGPHAYDWDGLLGGAAVPDGQYVVQVVGVRDGTSYAAPAANMADRVLNVASFTVLVDTTGPSIGTIYRTPARFSPNGDRSKDSTRITAVASGGSRRWILEIVDGTNVLHRFQGTGGSIAATWDGRRADGSRVPDGTYGVRITAIDALGNRSSRATSVVVDTVAPTGSVRTVVPGLPHGATTYSFSPDGDRSADVAEFRWSFGEAASGIVYVRNTRATVWRRAVPYGTAGKVTWNGRDQSGRAIPDGTYTVIVSVRDAAGNQNWFRTVVNLNRSAGYLRGAKFFYPQDGDRLSAINLFTFVLRQTVTTTIRVRNADGVVVRSGLWATKPAGRYAWRWNGRGNDGRMVPPGRYTVQLVAVRGTRVQILNQSVAALPFTIAPSTTEIGAGETLSVLVGSVEPLKAAPSITFAQAGLEGQTVVGSRQSDGRWKATFTVAAGGAGTAILTVAGTDSAGGTNVGSAEVTVH